MNDVRIDLGPIVREINKMHQNLASGIDSVHAEVGAVRSDVSLTSQQLQQLRAEFDAFVQTAMRTAAVQQSETKIVGLKAQLDREFGHYNVVRRTSTGTLQAFDSGLVSNDTVTSISEELMIQTPRYWLAPALVALASWSRDNQPTTEKAVQEAFSRDKRKASLFFALVLRRQGRLAASVRWLRHYLTSLDPSALTREFAVILEAASYNAFGPTGQHMISEFMTRWVAELRNREDIVEAQIRNWFGEIGVQRRKLDVGQYPSLAKLAPRFSDFQHQIELASALPEVILKYEEIKAHEATMPTVLEDLLDDILDRLVTEYDEEELPLKREVVYHESVIEESGDTARARARADELQQALEETNDVVSLQTIAAISPEQLGVSTQTQRIAIGVGASDFRSAVSRFTAAYRANALNDLDLVLGTDHSAYASTYGFPATMLHSSWQEEQGIGLIQSTWQATLDAFIEKLRFKSSWYLVPGLIAAGVTLVLLVINWVAGLVGLVMGAAIVFALGEMKKRKANEAVAKVEAVRDKAAEESTLLYRDALAELVDGRILYSEMDAQEGELLSVIETWPTIDHSQEVAG